MCLRGYLGHLAETDDFASIGVHSEEHSSGLGGVALEQFQGLVQSLGRRDEQSHNRETFSPFLYFGPFIHN